MSIVLKKSANIYTILTISPNVFLQITIKQENHDDYVFGKNLKVCTTLYNGVRNL